MVRFAALTLLIGITGCTSAGRSPDAIRQDTANATEATARDAKAVVQGIADGLKHHAGPVNINTASSGELQKLPGVTGEMADRIVGNRPYATSQDLLRRHLVTKAEYSQIADKIISK